MLKVFRFLAVTISIIFCSGTSYADQWIRAYGGSGLDSASSIQQTNDGGFIVAGGTASFRAVGTDAWLFKFNAAGNIEWQHTYGGSDSYFASRIKQTSDGGYIVLGDTRSFSPSMHEPDIWIVKLDSVGTIVWQKVYGDSIGNETASSIQQTADGGYIIAGIVVTPLGYGNQSSNAFVMKIGSDGNIQWQKLYGNPNIVSTNGASSIQQTADGGYLVAGFIHEKSGMSFLSSVDALTQNAVDPYGIWIFKIDPFGNIQWQRVYESHGDAFDLKPTKDGGYVIAGGVLNPDNGFTDDVLVLKIDSQGNISWQKSFGGKESDRALGIFEMPDGEYLVSGSAAYTGHGLLVRLNSSGEPQWFRTIGAHGDDGLTVYPASDGSLLLTGMTDSMGSNFVDMWIGRIEDINNFPGCSVIGTPTDFVISNPGLRPSSLNVPVQQSNFAMRDSNATAIDTAHAQERIIQGNICMSGTIQAPSAADAVFYEPSVFSSLNSNPAEARPIGLGSVAYMPEGVSIAALSLHVGLLSFAEPVDIYLGIFAPMLSPEVWLLESDNTLQPLSQGLVKWKENNTDAVDAFLFGNILERDLPEGTYTFYLAVTPAGRTDAFYLWSTFFQ